MPGMKDPNGIGDDETPITTTEFHGFRFHTRAVRRVHPGYTEYRFESSLQEKPTDPIIWSSSQRIIRKHNCTRDSCERCEPALRAACPKMTFVSLEETLVHQHEQYRKDRGH